MSEWGGVWRVVYGYAVIQAFKRQPFTIAREERAPNWFDRGVDLCILGSVLAP